MAGKKPRVLTVRVLLGDAGFEARLEGATKAQHKRLVGTAAASSSMAVRNLARELAFKPGFDVRYEGKAADGVGTIWSIVEFSA